MDSLDWLADMARATGKQQRTLLHCAVSSRDPNLLHAVLQLPGIDANAQDSHGWTALMLACSMDFPEAVAQLLAAKACVNCSSRSGACKDGKEWLAGTTPLMLAAAKGPTPDVQQLLAVPGIRIDAEDASGETAFWKACDAAAQSQDGAVAVMQQLAAAGADVNCEDNKCRTPLINCVMAASSSCSTGVVKELLAVPGVNVNVSYRYYTALMWACQLGATAVVELLLQAGADVNGSGERGVTPLSIACSRRDLSITRLLLAAPNVAVNHRDEDGCTALVRACAHCGRDATEVVQQLMQAGADVNSSSSHPILPGDVTVTALSLACQAGNTAVMKLLLAAGAALPMNLCSDAQKNLGVSTVIHQSCARACAWGSATVSAALSINSSQALHCALACCCKLPTD